MSDPITREILKEKGKKVMGKLSDHEEQNAEAVKYIQDCLEISSEFINHPYILQQLSPEHVGMRLLNEMLCLIRKVEGGKTIVEVAEIPIDESSNVKMLSLDEVNRKYGANKFGRLIFENLDKIERHYTRINEDNKHIHENAERLRQKGNEIAETLEMRGRSKPWKHEGGGNG